MSILALALIAALLALAFAAFNFATVRKMDDLIKFWSGEKSSL